ncbi:hypothetical protein HII17_08970 [Thalassotalea sp. M1531]|uniref:Uncharacterized protein n=1 Tax=Thalassotalea algicola TaxID=2716224 RepID=A0A7Y0LCQ2_9GAMM|nr:hypothetical protein [Thalassotalea algicola]NMP31692.1 hypothetical protein [Thalassotalea algicola]
MELLKLGRIDYIIFGLESGEIPDEIAQYTQTSFLYLLGTYHYVNSRHEGIFPQLEKAIVHNLALEKKNN